MQPIVINGNIEIICDDNNFLINILLDLHICIKINCEMRKKYIYQ